MKLLTKIKFALGLALTVAIGVLSAMLKVRTGQRDKQRTRADTAEHNHEAEQARGDQNARVSKARAEADDYNATARLERNETDKHTRRTGRLGGADRVRDHFKD